MDDDRQRIVREMHARLEKPNDLLREWNEFVAVYRPMSPEERAEFHRDNTPEDDFLCEVVRRVDDGSMTPEEGYLWIQQSGRNTGRA